MSTVPAVIPVRAEVSRAEPAVRDRQSWVLPVAVVTTILIGCLDSLTGWELSLYLFYAIPILFLVWHGEGSAAIVLSVLCGFTWWIANASTHPYHSEWSYRWSSLSRTVYLVLVAVGGNAVRGRQAADRVRIEALERTQRLEREIVSAAERERQRIGQDLHDGLCQQLAAIGCAAKSLADDLQARSVPEAEDAYQIESLLKDTVAQTRDLARGIAPVQLEGGSLAAALEELTASMPRSGAMQFRFIEQGDVRIADGEVATHLFRIAQEAVNNALKHSGARHITISLGQEGDAVRLSIEDDGVGMPAELNEHADSGMGLKTMRYRCRSMGARLEITPATSGGTRVSCVVQNHLPS